MIRLMIVEDEKATAADLKHMVEGLCSDMEVCSVCYDGETALKDIQQVCPDVIFWMWNYQGYGGLK